MSLAPFRPSSRCGKHRGRAALWLAAAEILLIVAWSSGFVGIRFAADYAPVLLVAFWRCVVVAFVLLPLSLRALKRASTRTKAGHAGLGL
ncbi:EamA/RhaT family transporter, partial [Serratia marcescens]|nr:EamA/RhaT family transporter [Serratia marcescens]